MNNSNLLINFQLSTTKNNFSKIKHKISLKIEKRNKQKEKRKRKKEKGKKKKIFRTFLGKSYKPEGFGSQLTCVPTIHGQLLGLTPYY